MQKGWISVSRNLATGELSSEAHPSVENLLERSSKPLVLAIDIPIGLTNSGPRECDRLARELVRSPRSSSVFPAPIRPALKVGTRKETDWISRSVDERGVGVQAWGLYERIREIDQLLRARPLYRRFIYEIHPEVKFAFWNGGVLLASSKKSTDGPAARNKLVDTHFGSAAKSTIRQKYSLSLVADDDIIDAFAALRTAERIWQGPARVLPDLPPNDTMGIEMGMW